MEDFKNITIDELKNFSGTICLYSLELEHSLGDNVKLSYGKLFQNNIVSYNKSLSMENKDDLIIIDGDDFNPSKVFGLTKKYTNPIVIFISNNSKIDKLKDLLLRKVLIINKNSLTSLNFEENIKNNIEAKRLRDLEKEKLLKEQESNENNNDILLNEPIKEDNNKNVEDLNNKKEKLEKLEEVINDNNSRDRDERTKNKLNLEDFKNAIKDDESNKINGNLSVSPVNSDIVKIDEEKKVGIFLDGTKTPIIGEVRKEEESKILDLVTNKNLKLEKIAFCNLNYETNKLFKSFFDNCKNISINTKEDFDIYIIDVSYASSFTFSFIENLLPKPIILISEFEISNKFKLLKNSNFLFIEKPINQTRSEIKSTILKYLNDYNLEEETKKVERFRTTHLKEDILDTEREIRIRNKHNDYQTHKKAVLENKPITKEDILETKKEINRVNKRLDKDISLDMLYKSLGLNALSLYESKINREVYSTIDGKVIKYKPNGYLIEVRLRRLKSQGLNEKEINSAMQRLEEADIRFEQKQLRKRDLYKIEEKKKNAKKEINN